ncbi:MAG: transcription termination/antitermination protein NusG [Lachnospiraceae bacterium]|nr:transcription termination/antitermination protein NusG [Lachnospiraceae bacterium]
MAEEEIKNIDDVSAQDAEKTSAPAVDNIKQQGDNVPHWYVVHTYSGYENKVKNDIEKTVENRKDLQEKILEVMIPTEDVVKIVKGKKKVKSVPLLPGYILVHMINNDLTWYIVRNTRGVTGFVGPASKPVPLSEEEMRRFGVRPQQKIDIDVAVGDRIEAVSGPWEGTSGTVVSVNASKETVTITTDMFNRDTSVEIDLADIQKE